MTAPNLGLFSGFAHDLAAQAFEAGNLARFLGYASNELSISIALDNLQPLRDRGLLEKAIVDAMIGTRLNNYQDYWKIGLLIQAADRDRLLHSGDPLDEEGPWLLYRGVAGHGRARRIRGYSWTSSMETAMRFAERGGLFGLANPAVYSASVSLEHVLFCSNERKEAEFFLQLPSTFPVKREPGTLIYDPRGPDA